VQLCVFGVCIPLDIIVPGILGVFYYLREDVLRVWHGLLAILGVRAPTVEHSNTGTNCGDDDRPSEDETQPEKSPGLKSE
jgi:hypothetical protein